MADSILGNYFSIDPSATTWGAGQSALASALPVFQTPGQGYQQNFGSALGVSLLSALLGYQARRSAAQQSLEAADLGQQMLKLQTPEERLGFIKNVDGSLVQERLLGLNNKLAEQELANKLAREQKISEFETNAGLELGPLGQALFQRKQAQAVEAEIAKAKGLQAFYATPEGEAAREFELRKIREEGLARREPLQDWLTKQGARESTAINVEGVKQTNRKELQDIKDATAEKLTNLKIAADKGNKQDEREFKAKTIELNNEFELNLAKVKSELGAEAALKVRQQTIELENQLLAENRDPKVARAAAIATITKQVKEDLLIKADELATKRNEENRKLIDNSTMLRAQIERENPKIPAAITTQVSNAVSIGEAALRLASRIQNKVDSFPELKLAKNFTSAGDGLREELKDVGDLTLRARTGAAAPLLEQENLLSIIEGTAETGPEQAISLLKQFAARSKLVAADKLTTASQNPLTLVNKLRESAQTNAPLGLSVNTLNGPKSSSDRLAELQAQLAELKATREKLQAQQGR